MTLEDLIAALTGERNPQGPLRRERQPAPWDESPPPARYPGQGGALRPSPMPSWVMQSREPLAVRRGSAPPLPPPAPPRPQGSAFADFEAQRRGAMQYGLDSVMRGDGWPEEMPRFVPGDRKNIGQQPEPPRLERPMTATGEGGVPLGALRQNRMRDAPSFADYINADRLTGRFVDPIAADTPVPVERGYQHERDWMRATEGALPNPDGTPAEIELPFMEQWQRAEQRQAARMALIRARRAYGN